MKAERIQRDLVYKGSIVDIYKDTIKLANNQTEYWDFVSHRKGAAAIIPVLPSGEILMVEQYRFALDRMTLELPAGSRDTADELYIDCARRELEEETGYYSNKLSKLLTLKTTVAFCDENIEIFIATDLKKGKQHLDQAEEITIKKFSLNELTDMIFSAKIQDSKTVSGILAYKTLLHNRSL